MDDFLPQVHPDIFFPLQREVENINDNDYIKKSLKAIRKSNPVVAMWIKEFSKKSKDKSMTAMCAIVVYRMLQSQQQSDILTDLL